MLLGRAWAHRGRGPQPRCADPMLAAGMPVLDAFADVGGGGARTALVALGRLDRGELGCLALKLAAGMEEPIPNWVSEVGTAAVVRAFSAESPGDGETLLLEAEPGQGTAHMLVVFIDARLGGIAKHLGLTRVIDPMNSDDHQPGAAEARAMRLGAIAPGVACQRVRQAIEITDSRRCPAVGESFAPLRALALARVCPGWLGHQP